MHILAIVPARGGSKEIPLKNIQKVAGKPLLEYTITAAKKSKYLDRVIVSTDNKKIAKIAISLGAEVPFLRPKNISRDTSSTIDVVKHALKFLALESYIPEIILVLQPTSPLRTTEMIDKSITLLQNSNATSVLSVSKIKTHPYSSFWLKGIHLHPFNSDFKKYHQRQKYPDLYYPTGAIYAFRYKALKKYDSLLGNRIKPLIVEQENSVDVDNKFDLFISEMSILYWKKFKKRSS